MNEFFRRMLGQDGLAVSFGIVLEDAALEPESVSVDVREGRAVLRARYGAVAEEEFTVSYESGTLTWTRALKNVSAGELRFKEFLVRLDGLSFGTDPAGDYFFHSENARIYGEYCLKVDLVRDPGMLAGDTEYDTDGGTRWADPGTVSERIGRSVYQPFPAVLVSNFESAAGIVHGSLSQERLFHNYILRHDAGGRLTLKIYSSCKAVDYLVIPPGGVLRDETSYLASVLAEDLRGVFSGYVRALEGSAAPAGRAPSPSRNAAIWDSWNEGVREDISEDELLAQADFIAAELPTVDWLQVDNGYAVGAKRDVTCHPHGLGMPYEGHAGLDRSKFPHGFRHFTDEVKKRGLKPAVWIGCHVPTRAPLCKDHPEWFLDYSYRFDKSDHEQAVLDISLPEVRDYVRKALDYYLVESGFMGVKLDFWSYAYEDSHGLLANRDRTGYDYRHWFLSEIRKRLPAGGFLGTACDIGMGNPFLGRYLSSYRFGIDIGVGHWDHMVATARWAAFYLNTRTGHFLIPNADAIGILPELGDAEVLTWINFCLVARAMVEVSGWLYKNRQHRRVPWVKKALCCPNNGEDVFFGDFDFRRDSGPPATWYFEGPHFSLQRGNGALPVRTVVLFNWGETARSIALRPESVGLGRGTYLVTDVWKQRSYPLGQKRTFRLGPHESRLLALSACGDSPRVLDAGVRLERVRAAGDRLSFDVLQPGRLELLLDRKPRGVTLGGRSATCSLRKKAHCTALSMTVEAPGTVELLY